MILVSESFLCNRFAKETLPDWDGCMVKQYEQNTLGYVLKVFFENMLEISAKRPTLCIILN